MVRLPPLPASVKLMHYVTRIPTTTIFSAVDMTVMPQFNNSLAGSATYVGGKFTGNILVQESCPNSTVGHNDFLVANFGYQVVKLAVASAKKYVTTSEVKQAVANGTIDCSTFYVSPPTTFLFTVKD